MTSIVLGDETLVTSDWSPNFIARAFPSLARIQFWTQRLLQKDFISIGDISKVIGHKKGTKEKKLRKALFYIMLKRLKTKQKEM